MKIGFISLGCSKNLVDTEFMIGRLMRGGHQIVNRTEEADAVIINTCGFIHEARKEAIHEILTNAALKEHSGLKVIIAAGCLTQRYPQELWDEIPELDAVLGVTDQDRICEIIDRCAGGERVMAVNQWPSTYTGPGIRLLTTPPGWAYLKIAEGCSNRCSYCAIPGIRGPLRSRPVHELITEAEWLADQGIKELVIIAQDTTAYGDDLADEDLTSLMGLLNDIPKLKWIRLMYAYPSSISEGLIEMMQGSKLLPYIDLPIQHYSDHILQRMGRRYTSNQIRSLLDRIRKKMPEIVLRTTLMTGFPGEGINDHKKNVELIKTENFDWVGVFAYSEEEGTSAARLHDDVDIEIKRSRVEEIMLLQQAVTRQKNQLRLGKEFHVLIERKIGHKMYAGRSWFQAPEVDGACLLESDITISPGDWVRARPERIEGYDLVCDVVDKIEI